ncbi:MAG: ribosomal-processing cysteine protease Prp [Lachnospiraceae bacterium]|jgi:uncharacterized protein YsxB (DUF464 family)|nr:ribosomal-processing cysteine protease Prp [Lachnospiraceae bacterium]
MTEISFYKDSEDQFTGFKCTGHSGYADEGSDIVCAAVSMLTFNFVNSVEKLLGVKVYVEQREADAYLDVSIEAYQRGDVQLLFRSLKLGLEEIEKNYKKYLRLTK